MRRRIFNEEHEAFRDSVRRFLLAEVKPHVERWREQGVVDREVWRKAGAQGLLLMWAEERYGGAGIDDFRFDQILSEECTRHGDPGFAITLHNRVVGPYLATLANDEQRARWLPGCTSGKTILAIAITEPGTGSDVSGIRTQARRDGDQWVLSGAKTYISNGLLSDLVLVVAKTDPDNPKAMGLFVVERGMEGFERGRLLKKIGMKAQDTAELFFHDVRIPAANVLGDPARGFHALMRFLPEERMMAAIRCLANAKASLDLTLDFVKQRRLFGRSLGAFQNTRFKCAELRVQVDMGQAFVDHCVQELLEHRLTPEMAAEAKLAASEIEGRVVDECLQLHGGAGYMEEYEISWRYTNARVSRIYAGSSEVMREIIGRGMGLDERTL
ncbi:acyl-CoA dehydrogenase family protein [Sinimarinibacterium flocculans]|uniref:acyl-CoA dehydrogenase family protein n=1 Tax=Sinimarinibacterium flocculans TaxID=985250 RepID=UPI00248F4F72|nr:acyl-CoA dehydrogenase family protein [Sinimarinibacterium flocculans]